MLKVAIIILNWNGWSDTMECLTSLNRLDYANFEIILIDNGSRERPPLVNAQFLKLSIHQIFNEQNLGFAAGNNQGIGLALERGAEYVLFLNNDTTVEPDFLKKLVAAAEADEKFGILGPVMHYYDQPEEIWFAGGRLNKFKTRGSHYFALPPEKLKKVDYITGCCLLISREVIEKIGLLNENYFLYYEDADWCQRARQAGYFCGLVKEAKIYHKQSRSAGEFSYPYIYYHSRNGLIFAARYGLKPAVYLISVWIFLKQIMKLIVNYKKEWAWPVTRGVWDFWRGKTGKLAGYY